MRHIIIEVVGSIHKLCIVFESPLLLLPAHAKHLTFMNNHVREHSHLVLSLALTFLHCVSLERRCRKVFIKTYRLSLHS